MFLFVLTTKHLHTNDCQMKHNHQFWKGKALKVKKTPPVHVLDWLIVEGPCHTWVNIIANIKRVIAWQCVMVRLCNGTAVVALMRHRRLRCCFDVINRKWTKDRPLWDPQNNISRCFSLIGNVGHDDSRKSHFIKFNNWHSSRRTTRNITAVKQKKCLTVSRMQTQ